VGWEVRERVMRLKGQGLPAIMIRRAVENGLLGITGAPKAIHGENSTPDRALRRQLKEGKGRVSTDGHVALEKPAHLTPQSAFHRLRVESAYRQLGGDMWVKKRSPIHGIQA
jgi:hypothetical protein